MPAPPDFEIRAVRSSELFERWILYFFNDYRLFFLSFSSCYKQIGYKYGMERNGNCMDSYIVIR